MSSVQYNIAKMTYEVDQVSLNKQRNIIDYLRQQYCYKVKQYKPASKHLDLNRAKET
jgi:hypothetical protein